MALLPSYCLRITIRHDGVVEANGPVRVAGAGIERACVVAVVGVAVLNGLVSTSATRQRLEDGFPVDAAIIEGLMARVRPVLMTALVACVCVPS